MDNDGLFTNSIDSALGSMESLNNKAVQTPQPIEPSPMDIEKNNIIK
jgi:hypothetical protein